MKKKNLKQGRGFVLRHGGAVPVDSDREPVLPVLWRMWSAVRHRRILRRVSCFLDLGLWLCCRWGSIGIGHVFGF